MAEKHNFWYLEEVDLYKYLCPHKFAEFQEKHTFESYKKNEFIYFQDDSSKYVYLIADGKVKVGCYTQDGEETIKTILSKGDLFGELALVGEEKRSEFAQSIDSKTTICPIHVDDMQYFMRENKALSFKIFKLMGFRIKKLERKIESLVFKDSRTSIIEFLKDLAIEKGVKIGFETMIRNGLTHKDIALLTGTSRQTVTTTLNDLKEQNLINFDRKQILIRDLEKLEELV